MTATNVKQTNVPGTVTFVEEVSGGVQTPVVMMTPSVPKGSDFSTLVAFTPPGQMERTAVFEDVPLWWRLASPLGYTGGVVSADGTAKVEPKGQRED
ncbi:6169_t:CDS:2 [Acaulospora colombiana]|uniref:6169_t:CDS:1 n=1 Tax=Acaulospora colombiana TaxID=27376 RepID=A0ACA9MIJ3_9GLOM|nr:6169_t:CDS:2 [Acaulospora colombiana]